MEDDGEHRVEVSTSVTVDRERILIEHGSADDIAHHGYAGAFRRYRQRILWQMVKRRWFATLTDYNTDHLFIRQSPAAFTGFVRLVVERVAVALRKAAAVDDNVAAVVRCDAARLVLKGGNMVNLLKYSSLRLVTQLLQQQQRERVDDAAPPPRKRGRVQSTGGGARGGFDHASLDARVTALVSALKPSGLSDIVSK